MKFIDTITGTGSWCVVDVGQLESNIVNALGKRRENVLQKFSLVYNTHEIAISGTLAVLLRFAKRVATITVIMVARDPGVTSPGHAGQVSYRAPPLCKVPSRPPPESLGRTNLNYNRTSSPPL